MPTIVKRGTVGRPITHEEEDANWTELEKLLDGTTAAPKADALKDNTGAYRTASQAAGALQIPVLDGSGNLLIANKLAIGAASSTYKLGVYEATGNGVSVMAGDASGDTILSLGSASTADKVLFKADGRVLVGMPNAIGGAFLQVSGSVLAYGGDFLAGNGAVTAAYGYTGTGAYLGTQTDHPISFVINYVEKMNLNKSGDLTVVGSVSKTFGNMSFNATPATIFTMSLTHTCYLVTGSAGENGWGVASLVVAGAGVKDAILLGNAGGMTVTVDGNNIQVTSPGGPVTGYWSVLRLY